MFFTSQHKRLLKRILFLLIPYSLLRVGFYFYHLETYKQFPQEEIFESFLYGIRFDLAAICLVNIFIILLSLIPSINPKFLKFERVLFAFVNTVGFSVAFLDYELFLFMGKRLSFDIFAVTDDIIDQLPQILLYYWYFPLASFALGVGVYFFDKSFLPFQKKKTGFLSYSIGSVLVLGLAFVGIRGGVQGKSINVQTAFSQGKNELGHLVLNTPYHFFRTLKNQRIEPFRFFASDDKAKNVILNRRDLRPSNINHKNFNIVLIILESFSLEYVEEGYTPFLADLMKESLSFERHLANGRRSIEALPSLLCGLPSLIDEPISKSLFQSNRFNCMPKRLKTKGYTNLFFHGGSRGTMGFESYTLSNGFDRYYSREDYPIRDDYDGTWGIFDEPFFQFSADVISKTSEPFLAGIFTLSLHQPYSVPIDYKDKFPKGSLEIHESIGYSDFALKQFFEKIKKEEWFKNTLFIITSDHSQKLETPKYSNQIGSYRVPLLLYAPGIKWGEINTLKVTQHSDIPVTVLDFLGVESDLPVTGVSVLSSDEGVALNYADGTTYLAVMQNKFLSLNKNFDQLEYAYDWETGVMKRIGPSEDPLLKAYLQYFINGLINNNLSI
jgi:phosphoglycerol transferase MdoB-like AlkP superfamily enzyme